MSSRPDTLNARGPQGEARGNEMVTKSDLSQMTVGDIYELCVRVNADPQRTLSRVIAFPEDAPNFLSGLLGCHIEGIKYQSEVA